MGRGESSEQPTQAAIRLQQFRISKDGMALATVEAVGMLSALVRFGAEQELSRPDEWNGEWVVERLDEEEGQPWCTCGRKTTQGKHHELGCPARAKADAEERASNSK